MIKRIFLDNIRKGLGRTFFVNELKYDSNYNIRKKANKWISSI